MATIHNLMDQFFESVTEFGDYQEDITETSPIKFQELSEGKNYQKIADRIINTIVFLEEMLL